MSKPQVNFKEILKDFDSIFNLINKIEENTTEETKKNILKKTSIIKKRLEKNYKNLDTKK